MNKKQKLAAYLGHASTFLEEFLGCGAEIGNDLEKRFGFKGEVAAMAWLMYGFVIPLFMAGFQVCTWVAMVFGYERDYPFEPGEILLLCFLLLWVAAWSSPIASSMPCLNNEGRHDQEDSKVEEPLNIEEFQDKPWVMMTMGVEEGGDVSAGNRSDDQLSI